VVHGVSLAPADAAPRMGPRLGRYADGVGQRRWGYGRTIDVMFVGHLGAGLAAKRLAPEVGLGVLFLAAMWLDALLWVFVLLGLESVHVPPSLGEGRYLTFTFPYSHGLVASLAWSAIGFGLVRSTGWSLRAGLVVEASVFSHFLLDALVHVAGLPLLGDASYHVGLGLWRHTGPELAVECALGGLGWWLYRDAPGAARGARRWGLAAVVGVTALLTIWGALAAAPPPTPEAMAVVSLLTIVALACWLERGAPAR
jgi:hypothetical protein